MAVGAVGVAGVVTARRAAGFRARARKAALRMALQRARAAQVAVWIEQFGIPNCGRLERDELAELLQHLKPEMGVPSAHVLDQLLIHATEVKTYSLYLRGDPNGSVCAELIMPTVSAYTTYCAVASAFDRRAGKGGMVALHELPALLREANHGVVPCETREFDYVMDCCSALLPGGLPLESTSVLSRQDVLLPFLAREIKFGKRVHVQDLLDDNASDDTISIKSDDDYGSIDDVEEDEEELERRWDGARQAGRGGGMKGGRANDAVSAHAFRGLTALTPPSHVVPPSSFPDHLRIPPSPPIRAQILKCTCRASTCAKDAPCASKLHCAVSLPSASLRAAASLRSRCRAPPVGSSRGKGCASGAKRRR